MSGDLPDVSVDADEPVLDRLAREAGDPELFPEDVRRLWEQGKGRKARKLLLKAAASERRQDRARRQLRHAGDYRLWLEPLRKAPSMTTLNGVGTSLYGKYQPEDDGTYISTLWFVVIFLPIWPLSSYLVAKAESGGWHFLARAPRPPGATMMQKFVLAVFAFLAGLGALAAYKAGTHTDIVVYNGFDRPIDVTVGESTLRLAPNQNWRVPDVPTEPTTLASAFSDGEEIESVEADLSSHSSDLVVYNVAGRGLLALEYIRYGRGEPKMGRWLEGGPVIFLGESVDYAFREPPDEKSVRDGGYIENSVLGAADAGVPAIELMQWLFAEQRVEQAQLLGLAELQCHPDNATLALWVARGTMEDPGEQRQLFRDLLARAPNAVDLHRYYQNLWPENDNQEVRDEYQAELEAHPDSAMHHYLLGRLLEDENAVEHYREAMRLDSSFDKPHLAMGFRSALQGRLDEAKRHYAKYAAFGDQQTLEVADTRFRLERATGGSSASLRALLAETSAAGRQAPRTERQRLHFGLAADPSRLETSIRELETLEAAEFGVEPGGPELANTRADLAITAGDLERARAELATAAEVGDPAYWTSFRLALSDGATDQDVERLTSRGSAWLDAVTFTQSLAGWDFLDADTRAEHLEPFLETDFAAMLELLAEPSALRDVPRVEAAVGALPVDERGGAFLAAAQRLKGLDDAQSRSARRIYLERARAFSVPGELPHLSL